MKILDPYEPLIKGSLLPKETFQDLRLAAQIIVKERLRSSGREQATTEDAEVALLSLCIPIPGGPPKKAKYEDDVKKFRRETVPGSVGDEEKQKKLSGSLQGKLLQIRREDFDYPSFQEFFQIRAEGKSFTANA